MMEKEGVFPPNYALLKAVVGDKSDNISGINGVGEKSLKRDFPLFYEKENADVSNLLEYAGQQKNTKYDKYIKNEKLLKDNYKIVQLLDIDVNMQSIQALEKSYENKKLKFNSYQLRLKLMGENIAPSNIDNWISSFMSVSREPITL